MIHLYCHWYIKYIEMDLLCKAGAPVLLELLLWTAVASRKIYFTDLFHDQCSRSAQGL